MNNLVRAALTPEAGWFLLVDPSPSLVVAVAQLEKAYRLTALCRRRGLARRCRARIATIESAREKATVIVGVPEDVPFPPASFDSVVCAAGLPTAEEPVPTLKSLQRIVRPGGSLLVMSRIREGTAGSLGSMLRSAVRRQPFPRAADLTAWMLHAGLRSIRQAYVSRSVVPAKLTWARVHQRPWERGDAELS